MFAALTLVPIIFSGRPELPPFDLIIPGGAVGSISLQQNLAGSHPWQLKPLTGPNSEGDAAMGHVWNRFQAVGKGEIDIYTVRGANDSAATPEALIDEIRVTSRTYATRQRVKVGSSQSRIRRAYRIKQVSGAKGFNLYDDVADGIAFEFKGRRCSAIIVHPKNQRVDQIYLPYHS